MVRALAAAVARLALATPLWYLSGRVAQRLHLPLLTGYLIAGIVTGPQVLGLITQSSLDTISLLERMCLSLIALAAGAELHLAELRKTKHQARGCPKPKRPAGVAATVGAHAATGHVRTAGAHAHRVCRWLHLERCVCGGHDAGSGAAHDGAPAVARGRRGRQSGRDARCGALAGCSGALRRRPLPLLPLPLPLRGTARCSGAGRSTPRPRRPACRAPPPRLPQIAVLRETEGRGPFCSLIMAVVVVKDVLVFVFFAINVELIRMVRITACDLAARDSMQVEQWSGSGRRACGTPAARLPASRPRSRPSPLWRRPPRASGWEEIHVGRERRLALC